MLWLRSTYQNHNLRKGGCGLLEGGGVGQEVIGPKYSMSNRNLRFTVRLSETELSSVMGYADKIRAIPSAALRHLISLGLRGDRSKVPPEVRQEAERPNGR
jgi:hypothetical protein